MTAEPVWIISRYWSIVILVLKSLRLLRNKVFIYITTRVIFYVTLATQATPQLSLTLSTLQLYSSASALALASQLTLYPFCIRSQLTLPLASLCLFPPYRARVPKTPVARVTQAFSTKLFTWKDWRYIDVPDDAAALATLFWFGRYLRPFVHDTTDASPKPA